MRNEGVSDPFSMAKGSLRPFFPPQKGKARTSQNPLSENPLSATHHKIRLDLNPITKVAEKPGKESFCSFILCPEEFLLRVYDPQSRPCLDFGSISVRKFLRALFVVDSESVVRD